MQKPTPREVTKFIAKCIVHGHVSAAAETTITNHTRFDDDDMIVAITSNVIGWYVAGMLKPLTDGAVDKTFDFVIAQREARKLRKENPTP